MEQITKIWCLLQVFNVCDIEAKVSLAGLLSSLQSMVRWSLLAQAQESLLHTRFHNNSLSDITLVLEISHSGSISTTEISKLYKPRFLVSRDLTIKRLPAYHQEKL